MKKKWNKKDWERWNEEHPATFHLLATRLYKILEHDEGENDGRIKAAWHTLDEARERIDCRLREILTSIERHRYEIEEEEYLYRRIEKSIEEIADIIRMKP